MALNFFHDRIYTQIPFTDDDLRLYQTPEMTRLRQVSLSAIPPWILPCGLCASKFEHSVGVKFLAEIVGNQSGFASMAKNIVFAGLAHDVGTPPFSHMSEYFLKLLHGKDHEEFAEDLLLNSQLAEEFHRQGGDVETILKMITGKLPGVSDVVNGSIDIDNLDNSLRYCLSMGLVDYRTYRPEVLARSYRMSDSGDIYLDESALSELPGWEECRVRTYAFVYSEHNLAPGSMLHRAMDLATREGVDEIPPEYFRFTDTQAYRWLLDKCSFGTQDLARKVEGFRFHQPVIGTTITEENPSLSKLISEPRSRGLLADEIAELLSLPREAVAVIHGKNKGNKQIHLPIRDKSGALSPSHRSMLRESWYIRVFVAPENIKSDTRETIHRLLLSRLPELSF